MGDVRNDIGWFWVSWKSGQWRPHLQRCMLVCISFLRHKNQTNKIHYVYGKAYNCLIYILRFSIHLCQFIEELLFGLWTETHHTYRLYTSLQTLYHFMISSYGKFQTIITSISIFWSNLTRLTTLYSCNRNITLKISGLRAETCRWKYHNRNTPVELSVMSWSSVNSQV